MKPRTAVKLVSVLIVLLFQIIGIAHGQSINVTSSLQPFSSCPGVASSTQTVFVSGSSLTANVVVTAPSGYEVSTTSTGTFTSSINLSQVAGSLNASLFVRLSSSAANGASGNIQFSSTGATTRTVATQPAVVSNPTMSITRSGSPVTSGCTAQSYVFTGSRDPNSASAWTSTPSGLFTSGGTPSKTQFVTPSTSGTYSVVYKDVSGCESAPVSFSVSSSPSQPTISTTPVNYCLNDVATSLTATASAGNELRWYGTTNPMTVPNPTSSATASIPSTTSAGTTQYYVTQRNANGCESNAATIRVIVTQVAMTINTVSDVTTEATSFTIPYGSTTGSPNTFSIAASSSRPLSGFVPVSNESFSSSPITVNLPSGLSVGTYDFDFTLKNANNCTRAYTVALNIVSATSPRISTSGTFTAFSACSGTASVAQSVSVTAANLTNDLSIAAPTGYQVSLSSSTGFASSVSITPVAGSISSTSVFLRLASSATNGASGNLVFSSAGATSQSIATGSAIIFNKTTIMGLLSACIGGTSVLTPNEGPFGTSTPIWTTSNPSIVSLTSAMSPNNRTANALAQGSSTITYTDKNGCNSDPYNFVVNPLPTISGPTSVCIGSDITLTGSGTPSSNPWTVSNTNSGLTPDFSNFTRVTVRGVTQGSSIITYTLGGGCTTTTTLSVNPELSITSSTTFQQACIGATPSALSVNPTGSGSFTYQWYSSSTMSTSGGTAISGATNSSYTPPAPTSIGDFYYYPVVSNGQCSKTGSSYRMTVNATPVAPTVSSSTNSVCNSGSFILTANSTGGGTIKWYDVATGGTPLSSLLTYATPIISTTSTYYVDVTNSSGCVSSRTAYTAIVNQTPVFTTQPTASSAVCLNGTAPTLTVAASGGSITYAWYRNTTNSASGGTLITGNNTATYTPPSTSAGTTYYYAQASNACTGSTPVASNVAGFTVNPLPTAPLITASGATSICTGQTVILTSSYATGNVWYKDGVVLPSGTSASITVSSAGSYTVEHTNANGCLSPASSATQVLVNTTPTVSSSIPANRCDAGTVVLGATASAGTLNWYAASTGGTSLGTGTSFTTPSISATTTYYVDATNSGCTSARTAVVATVNTTPTVSSTAPASRCDAGTVVLGATASAGTLNWYAASTGGTSLGTGTSFTTPSISATTTYYVDATNNGCTSARTAVVATVNTTPSVASTSPANRCGPGILTLSATASAGTLNWYAASTGGSLLGTGTSYTTPSISATTTYYVDAVRNGCTSSRSPVVAAINTSNPITAQPVSNTIVCTTDNPPSLSVTTNGGGLSYQWYSNTNNSNSGGNIINSANASTYNPPFNTAGQLYYYVIVTDANCTVTERSSVARVEVKATPTVTSSAPVSRCDAGTVVLGATASAGTLNWYAASTGGASLATGASFTTPSISATTTYHVEATSNGCTSARTAVLATVNTTPTVSSTAPSSRCDVGTVVLGATASAGTLNWYAASTGGPSLGTGTSFTTPSINATSTYYVDATNNGCTSARTAVVATVTAPPSAGTLSGSQSICNLINRTTTFSSTVSGGTWSSSDQAVATVSTDGLITGVAAGTATITYTVAGTGGCAAASATRTVTVTALLPSAGILSGIQSICISGTTTFVSTVNGGTWSTSNTSVATVSTSGVITGVAAGVAPITYRVDGTGGCPGRNATRNVTVTAPPSAGSLSGTQGICVAGTTTFSSTANGGTWSSSDQTVATVSASGVITGVAAGTATITYTVAGTGGCADAVVTRTVTVTAPPSAGTLSGTQGICVAGTTTFVSTVNGGTWSSSDQTVATVSTSGVITGVAAGTATITYTVAGTGGCADAVVTRTVTVTAPPSAGTLSGTQGICVAGTTTFVSTVNGGTWSSSDQTVATVSASGVITGVAAGTATITYTVAGTGGCADAVVTRTVTVTAPPSAGTLSGTQGICVAGTTTFASTVNGGTWSSSDQTVATVSTSGVITGVAVGTATITYTVAGNGGCADAVVTRTVTVTAPPSAGTLSGTQGICVAGTTTFVSTVNGGTWSSSDQTVATVSTSGVITGVAAGTATITYTVAGTGGCSDATTTRTVTVTAPPSAGTLSGTQGVCVGLTTTFSSTANGGTWSSSNTSVATVSTSGVITGVAAGTATITYTVAGNGGCADAVVTRTVTVTAPPSAGTLSGTQGICVAGTTTFISTVNGGTWSSSDQTVATVSTSGVITGVAVGTATITYTVAGTGGCADAVVTRTVTVTAPPSAGTLSGTQGVCVGLTTTFSSTANGGTWSSSNTSVATVSAGGVITGVAAGTATITYTVAGNGGCADAVVTRTVTVNALPVSGNITGTLKVAPFTSHTYSIAAVANAQVYKWILPSGWTGTSDINAIDLQSGTNSGEITVQVINTNGCQSNISKIMVVVDAADTDNDGVPDLVEEDESTNKNDAKLYKDTDKDGVPDYLEKVNGTSVTDNKQFIDTDAGGTPDYVETKLFVVYGLAATDPNNSADDKRDTDEDKSSDYQEILNGTNPNDAPANLQYNPNNVIITIGNPLNVSAPTYTAGKPKKYSITPVLPAGIILNEATGVISGIPTVLSTPAKQYTITATNGGGSTTGSFTLTVIDIPPTNLRYNPNSQRATRNVAINNMLPSSSGGAVVTYSISPNLPAGLSLNTSTGIISGTLTAVLSGTVQYTIRATNSGGSTTTIVTLIYNTPPSDIALSRSVIYEGNAQGDQIGNLSTTDIDPLDTHTYSLVNGVGSDDNASFTILGNQLRAAETFVFANKNSYTVRVRTTDNGGLFFEKVITVSILELPTLTGTNSAQFNGGPSSTPAISKGFSTQLSIKGTDIVSVLWTPSTGLSATNILNPVARPTVTTTYTVTIRNAAGAVVVMKITVEVKDDYFVEPANILTPNRDGINDFWIIKNLDSYPQNEVSIFDRNGKMLYRMTNYNNRWDGRINGKPLSTGTYYYILRFPERPSILHKGFITIIQ